MAQVEFAYAQARLQARLGEIARTTRWQAVEAGRGAAQFLAALRGGALAHWVEGLDAAVDAQRAASVLRAKWSAHVVQVAGWSPAAWRAAIRWFGLLPELARIDALRSTGRIKAAPLAGVSEPLPAASIDDPTSAPASLPATALESLGALTVPASELGVFAVPYETTTTLWSAEFRRRLPRPDGGDAEQPARLLLPVLGGDRAGRAMAYEQTAPALVRIVHRAAASPAAVFAFLALTALDVERVRGGLLARRLLPRAPQAEGG